MKIGMDAKRIVRNASGLGSYGRNLVNALAHTDTCPELLLYAPDAGRDDLRAQVEPSPKVHFAYSGRHCRIARDLWRSRGIVNDLRRDGIDLYHGLSGELPHGLHKSGVKGLVTIHDLIFLRHPEYYHWIDTRIYRRKFYATLAEADRVVAISECTKRDILYYSDYPADRIDVVYQACSTVFRSTPSVQDCQRVRQLYHLPGHYMLNVGTIEERKNALLAVRALALLPKEICLVMVGRKTSYTNEVMEYAAQHGLSDRISVLHGVPNADLPAIYHQADVFVYPSRYEGFGIPIIEAIQSGLPVVAATGSCLEEAGGPHCRYVDPDDDTAMAQAIDDLMGNNELREKSVKLSRQYIARFENQDLARQMLNEYARCLA